MRAKFELSNLSSLRNIKTHLQYYQGQNSLVGIELTCTKPENSKTLIKDILAVGASTVNVSNVKNEFRLMKLISRREENENPSIMAIITVFQPGSP